MRSMGLQMDFLSFYFSSFFVFTPLTFGSKDDICGQRGGWCGVFVCVGVGWGGGWCCVVCVGGGVLKQIKNPSPKKIKNKTCTVDHGFCTDNTLLYIF